MGNKTGLVLFLWALVLVFSIIFISGCKKETVSEKETIFTPTQEQIINGTAEVIIQNGKFTPAQLTITKGSRVIWKNLDSVQHTVTFDNNENYFISYILAEGSEASNYFNFAGEYAYFCSNHPEMTGKLIVK